MRPPIPLTVTIAEKPTNIPSGRTYTQEQLVGLEKRARATDLRKVFNFDLFFGKLFMLIFQIRPIKII